MSTVATQQQTDVVSQAKADWAANKDGIQANFSSERAYVGYRKAAADGSIRGALGSAGGQQASPGPLTKDQRIAQARQEWQQNTGSCRDRFMSEDVFVSYRTVELAGQIRSR